MMKTVSLRILEMKTLEYVLFPLSRSFSSLYCAFSFPPTNNIQNIMKLERCALFLHLSLPLGCSDLQEHTACPQETPTPSWMLMTPYVPISEGLCILSLNLGRTNTISE